MGEIISQKLYNLIIKLPIKPIQVATALIKNNKGEILLLKRNEKNYYGYWQFPEGKLNKKENPREALIRELSEELGSKEANIISEIGKFPLNFRFLGVKINATRHLYNIEINEKIVLSKEHSEYGWFSVINALKLKLAPGVKDILNRDAISVA